MHRGVHAIGGSALALVLFIFAAVGTTGCNGDGSGRAPISVPTTTPPAPAPPPVQPAVASPCAGTVVLATLLPLDDLDVPPDLAVVDMVIELTGGSEDVAFDWIGPYRGDNEVQWAPDGKYLGGSPATFQLALMNWTTNTASEAVQHALTFAWPARELPGLEAGIRFYSDDGACPGEPSVVCTGTGCELRYGNVEPSLLRR